MNQATDIMREHFQQDFVDLRNSRLAANGIAEHALDRRERSLDIRPFVIRLQKLLAMQNELSEQPIPSLRWRRALRVALERNEGFRALADRQFQVCIGTVRLVAEYARDVELLHCFRDERSKERRVLGIPFGHLYRRDDVSFHSADRMNLNPIMFAAHFLRAVLFLLPESDKLCAGKSRGVDREVGFHRAQWNCRSNDQVVNDRRDSFGFETAEKRIVVWGVGDESLALGIPQVSHETPRAASAVNLERGSENHVTQWQARATASLLRFRHIGTQVAEQVEEHLFLADLGRVVRGPVLRIGDADSGGFSYRRSLAVHRGFTEQDVLHGVHVFAGLLTQLEVGAGAVFPFAGNRHRVAPLVRLRRDDPSPLVPFRNLRGRRDNESPLLPCVDFHVVAPVHWYIPIVYPSGGTCQYRPYRLLVDTRGNLRWQRKPRKSAWSSWTDAVVDAGTNGCREKARGRWFAPNANRRAGTNRCLAEASAHSILCSCPRSSIGSESVSHRFAPTEKRDRLRRVGSRNRSRFQVWWWTREKQNASTPLADFDLHRVISVGGQGSRSVASAPAPKFPRSMADRDRACCAESKRCIWGSLACPKNQTPVTKKTPRERLLGQGPLRERGLVGC